MYSVVSASLSSPAHARGTGDEGIDCLQQLCDFRVVSSSAVRASVSFSATKCVPCFLQVIVDDGCSRTVRTDECGRIFREAPIC